MYKHALGGTSTNVRHPKSAPNSYWRKFYYPKILEDLRLGRKFTAYYHKNAPAWLLEEVARFSPAKWLAYWNQKTGEPRKRLSSDFKKTCDLCVAREARPRRYWRSFYYETIEIELGRFRKHYGKMAPAWLVAEVENYTPRKWLVQWDVKVGKWKPESHVRGGNSK